MPVPRPSACMSAASSAISGSLAYLAVGTGIAAGVILDGALHRGARGLAEEIGRTSPASDVVCTCGSVAASRHSPPARPSPAARPDTRRTSTMPRPRGILTRSRSSMRSDDGSPGRPSPRHLPDVERVVIGGGVSHAGPAFSDPIHRGSRACVEPHPRPENCSRPASSRSCRRRRKPAPGAPSPSLVRPERPATRPRAGPPRRRWSA